jgi:flagellar biosynthesis protein FlhF
MNVRKFAAGTSREALRKVRDALGPDAVILSSRPIEDGVEILALAGEDASSIASSSFETETTRRASSISVVQRSDPVQAAEVTAAACAGSGSTSPATAGQADLSELLREVRSMRGVIQSQLAELSWDGVQKREPRRAAVLKEMLAAGFSAGLSRHLMESMPPNDVVQGGIDWVRMILARNLVAGGGENDIVEKGGVYALVGPTGVGKTTTTAKLAAHCVIRRGASTLALITTDGYRIGGHEQLRIYGKILGVMVHSVKDAADLRIALEELRSKHTVLIDTAGVGQRDQMVAEQVAMLSGTDTNVKRILCLSATSTCETLNEVIRAYVGDGLAGCIITKLDEAVTIGSVLDAVIRQKLNLFYVTNGQRVPEDIHFANRQYLVDTAFRLKREAAQFHLRDDELPVLMAETGPRVNDPTPKEITLG